jgi:allophanate hydrolase subunit 1
VEAVSGERVVEVRFDQNRTSPQELGTVLTRSGYPQQATRHGGGSCCGSCGG